MISQSPPPSPPIHGFTLIELSMVIAILSMVLTGGLVVGTNVVQQQSLKGTRDEIATLQAALIDYQAVNGRLPCVAPINAALSTATFGREITPGSTTCDANTTVPAGTWRVAQGGGQVRIGGIPTRTLGLPDRAAADKFGNRYLYAVTETHTSTTGFSSSGNVGLIRLQDLGGNDISNNASFVVVSHGKNAQGAYKYFNGVLALTCTSGLEQENCDNDGIFIDERYNDANSTNYFDDLVSFAPKYLMTAGSGGSATSLWAASSADIYSVGTDSDFRTGSVGIGTQTPVSGFEVVYDNRAAGIANDIVFSRYENSSDGGPIVFRRARGTPTAPLNLQNGDQLGGWGNQGYVNGGFNFIDGIYSNYEGNGSSYLSSMTFFTSGLIGAGPTTGPQERMRIASNGNIGINTSTPSQKLHITSPVVGDATQVQIGQGQGSLFLTGPDPLISGNLRYDDAQWRYEAAGAGTALYFNGSGSDMTFLTAPVGAAGAVASLSERMRLTNAGNLGIQNSAPSTALHVGNGVGFSYDQGVTIHSRGPTIYMRDSDERSAMMHLNGGWLYFLRGCDNASDPYTGNSWCTANGWWPLILNMESNNAIFGGNVGIGTYSPLNKLHIEGGGIQVPTVSAGNEMISFGTALSPPAASENTDPVYIQRANAGYDQTLFSIVVGDNVDPWNWGTNGDRFRVVTGIGEAFVVQSNGEGWFAGPLNWNSDRSLKKDIRALKEYGLETVMALKPSIYKMKKGDNRDKIGFIAQDIQKLIPEIVSEHEESPIVRPMDPSHPSKQPDKADQVVKPKKTLTLEYTAFIPVLTRAIQDIKHEHDALKAEVEAQKKELAAVSQSGPAPSAPAPESPLTLLYALIGMLSLGLVALGLKVNMLSKKLAHTH